MEIGTAGLMRNYMARKCDIHFPLERKLSRFLTAAMRVYRVPEEEQARVLAFIQSLDIKTIATKVMYKLFAMLEMKYDFKLSENREIEVTRNEETNTQSLAYRMHDTLSCIDHGICRKDGGLILKA